jgi:hypothetical protein
VHVTNPMLFQAQFPRRRPGERKGLKEFCPGIRTSVKGMAKKDKLQEDKRVALGRIRTVAESRRRDKMRRRQFRFSRSNAQ